MTDRQTLVLMFERADLTVTERGTDLVLPAWHEAMPDAQDITISFDENGKLVSIYAWDAYA